MRDALLGIDLGTTAVKLGLFAPADGALLALSVQEYPLETPREGWAELPAETYWRSVVTGVAALRQAAPEVRIAAIGLSSQGQTFVLLDEADRPLRPAVVWLDTRGGKQCERLLTTLGADAYKRHTGLAFPQAISSAPKLAWLAEHEAAVWRQVRHVAMLPAYIGHRLTGVYGCDPCNLRSSGLFGEYGYWAEAMAAVGVERDWLDTCVPTGGRIGEVSSTAARELGIDPGTPVGAGSNDQLTGAIGVGNVTPGLLSGAIGTAMALVATLPASAYRPEARLTSYPYPVADLRYAMPFAMTTGILLRWYRDRFGHGADYDALIALARKAEPGANGLTMLPHCSGTGPPVFDANARGGLLGLTLGHGPEHLVRAILEAVAFTMRDAREQLAASYPVAWQAVRVLGGATRSPFWMQMMADVSSLPVELPACSEAAVLGGALCGGVAGGLLPDLAEAGRRAYRSRQVYEPGPEATAYEAPYRRYRDAMERLYPGALGLS